MNTLNKRTSLEQFISEQTIGPGINGYRFIDLNDEVLINSNISELSPLDYLEEVIDIVPAAVYSTGILFPDEIKKDDCNSVLSSPEDYETNEKVEFGENNPLAEDLLDNSTLPDIDEDDSIEIDQMYPRTMGFTCCLNNDILTSDTFDLSVSARYYKKIIRSKENSFNERFAILCEVERNKINEFIKTHGLTFFSIHTVGPNDFLKVDHISSEQSTVIKGQLRQIQKDYAGALFDKTLVIIELPTLSKANCFLSNLKSTIFYELQKKVVDNEIRNKLYEITQEIELIENISDHFRSILDVNHGGYGLWKAETLSFIVRVENLDFPPEQKKKSFLYNKPNDSTKITIMLPNSTIIHNSLNHIFRNYLDENETDFASLSLNIQLSRNSRKDDKRIFLKAQLINTSLPFNELKQDDNRYYSTFNELVNQKSFFGVKLSITNDNISVYNSTNLKGNVEFDEDDVNHFVYEQFKDYGIGHGCSVKWNGQLKTVETEYIPFCDTPDVDPIPRNKSLPHVLEDNELKDPLFLKGSKAQEFKWLSIFSDTSDEQVVSGLNEFVDAYKDWIEIKKTHYENNVQYKEIAAQELKKCEADYERMRLNIECFLNGSRNKQNMNSFRLMNGSMFMQIWHSVGVKNDRVKSRMHKTDFSTFDYNFYKYDAEEALYSPNEPVAWRAFQLAFILLNLDGIFKPEGDQAWEKRNEWVDLVWFPTGGGKTEAYLGLIALTIINRRKVYGEKGGGTAAIMRYTLRLLTLQQFQRATLVVMALELMRRWGDYELGIEPITIGLWVGLNSIPNTNEDLIDEFKKLNAKKENKIPFTECPWCKSNLLGETNEDDSDGYSYGRVHLKCSEIKCSFSFGWGNLAKKRPDQGPIPVSLSDEVIYLYPPALLFGTVDKFAQLAHKVKGGKDGLRSDSRRIFGKGYWDGKDTTKYLPPDLIIQDELHLLLGPLGSAVALFESAIDQLCTREDGTRPKIISSTATTRNTNLQIAALFDRKVNLFPKPGVECDDSFYAFYKRRYLNSKKDSFEFISKRRYIGIIPTGRTQIWMQMRLTAIFLTHRALFELNFLDKGSPMDFTNYSEVEKSMDYYHTTISYFNSLKEVGKTQSQVQSYMLKELRRVFNRVIRPKKLMHSIYTYGPLKEAELTGRLSGEEVKNELKKVEKRWKAANRFARIVDNNLILGDTPPEFVAATNMISVGIDVSRFNTIIMNSMPRNTAEYIQASSRVARDSYGLVATVHHPFRARDVSHYERFIEFHEKMYSYVEPISITPFTYKSVDRYLGLYLATIIRHKTEFVEKNSASNIIGFSDDRINTLVQLLSKYFDTRKERLSSFDSMIQNLLRDENTAHIRAWLLEAFREWKIEADKTIKENKDFVFNNKSKKARTPQEQLYVDIEEYEGNVHSKKWQVPMSLRVIEPEACIKINPL